MSISTRSVLVALGLFGLLALTACNSQTIQVTRPAETDPGDIPLPATAGEPAVTRVEVTRIVEREVERIVEVTPTPTPIPSGGYLITALSADAVQFNPLLSSDESSQFINSLLFGGMLRTDPFTGELICHFCQDWRMEGRTVTFTLRDDITWSDGEGVTVDDFIYTYAALFWGAANESLDTPSLDLIEEIDTISKIDERTVAVTLKAENCAALHTFQLGWLPQHLFGPGWGINANEPVSLYGPFGDPDDPHFAGIEASEMNRTPIVSSGPFVFREWVPGDHITLVRNASYFKASPHVDGLVVRIVPDEETRVQMLRIGEINVLERLDPSDLTQIELMQGLTVYKVVGDSYSYLGLQLGNPNSPQPRWLEDENTGSMVLNEDHGGHPILSDQRVRQAIAYGIDRNAIINQVAVGQGVPVDANMLPSLQWAYNDDLAPRDYDPQAAATLLDEAGWTLNENTGVRENGGRPLRLALITNLSSDTRVQIGELVQAQLEELGFDISFEALEWGSFVGLFLEQQFDMVVVSWSNLTNDPDDSVFFASENDVPGRGFNTVSYYNPALDDLWVKAATLPGCSTADRAVLYRQIQATLYDELPYAWLYAPLELIGASRQIVGLNPGPWDTWHNVETWYLTR
jgi:peptide/nickel transport system substrate-binding protein